MKARCWVLAGMFIVIPQLSAKILKDLLLEQQIPVESFSVAELGETVDGGILLGGLQVLELAYEVSGADTGVLPAHVLKYDRKSGVVLKSKLQVDKTDVCFGSLTGMMQANDFTLVSIDVSPSAECTLVLNDQLVQAKTLYGFRPQYVAPDEVVLIENMIHFGPVHPERLQLADLKRGTTIELYPPEGDALRAKLARENAERMPPPETCVRTDDPCDPKLFDETVLGIATDSASRFAFVVRQSASHAAARGEPTGSVAPQSVLYIYARGAHGWLYCEDEISDAEATMLTAPSRLRSWQFQDTEGRCTPWLPVIPDMFTAVMNPFLTNAH